MRSKHDHYVNSANPQRKRCPVCRQAVYSPAGIHPQCAMAQAESPKLKGERPEPPSAAETV